MLCRILQKQEILHVFTDISNLILEPNQGWRKQLGTIKNNNNKLHRIL